MHLSRFALLLPLVVFVPEQGLGSRPQVRLENGRVIVHARGTPLTDVLNRFSEATGAKIVYDQVKPSQLVSVEIDAASEAEALAQLLEGQGLGYALRLDRSGRGVEMLFLTAKGGGGAPRSSTTADERVASLDPPQAEPMLEEPDEADEPDEQAKELPKGQAMEQSAEPPTVAPVSGPSAGAASPRYSPSWQTAPASYPSAPASFPSYPVPASYPAPAPVLIPRD
jgi:hypothetical protein